MCERFRGPVEISGYSHIFGSEMEKLCDAVWATTAHYLEKQPDFRSGHTICQKMPPPTVLQPSGILFWVLQNEGKHRRAAPLLVKKGKQTDEECF